jgi:hypothetical protein
MPAGDAGIVHPAAFPMPWVGTLGPQFAMMTTSSGADDPPPPVPPFVPPPFAAALPVFAPGAVLPPALEGALGLPPGSLAFGVEGSGIVSAPFAVPAAGGILSFDFQLASNEFFRAPGLMPDGAFYSVDGGPPLPIALALGAGIPTPPNPLFGFDFGPGVTPPPFFGTVTHPVALSSAMMHTVAFGIVDVGDGLFSSGLLIDNVDIAAVPEIGALWLGALTCAATGLVVGLRRTRTAWRS